MLISAVASYARTPIRNTVNGHYYDLVVSPTPITWQAANDAARNSFFRGRVGYLATITSVQESLFLLKHLYKDPSFPQIPSHYSIWLGGFRWPPSAKSANSWRWVTGEPWRFTRWASGEPNNAAGEENRLAINGERQGAWNDLAEYAPGRVEVYAYVVEYGRVIVPTVKKKPSYRRHK